jgi:hypothetical protein
VLVAAVAVPSGRKCRPLELIGRWLVVCVCGAAARPALFPPVALWYAKRTGSKKTDRPIIDGYDDGRARS